MKIWLWTNIKSVKLVYIFQILPASKYESLVVWENNKFQLNFKTILLKTNYGIFKTGVHGLIIPLNFEYLSAHRGATYTANVEIILQISYKFVYQHCLKSKYLIKIYYPAESLINRSKQIESVWKRWHCNEITDDPNRATSSWMGYNMVYVLVFNWSRTPSTSEVMKNVKLHMSSSGQENNKKRFKRKWCWNLFLISFPSVHDFILYICNQYL